MPLHFVSFYSGQEFFVGSNGFTNPASHLLAGYLTYYGGSVTKDIIFIMVPGFFSESDADILLRCCDPVKYSYLPKIKQEPENLQRKLTNMKMILWKSCRFSPNDTLPSSNVLCVYFQILEQEVLANRKRLEMEARAAHVARVCTLPEIQQHLCLPS